MRSDHTRLLGGPCLPPSLGGEGTAISSSCGLPSPCVRGVPCCGLALACACRVPCCRWSCSCSGNFSLAFTSLPLPVLTLGLKRKDPALWAEFLPPLLCTGSVREVWNAGEGAGALCTGSVREVLNAGEWFRGAGVLWKGSVRVAWTVVEGAGVLCTGSVRDARSAREEAHEGFLCLARPDPKDASEARSVPKAEEGESETEAWLWDEGVELRNGSVGDVTRGFQGVTRGLHDVIGARAAGRGAARRDDTGTQAGSSTRKDALIGDPMQGVTSPSPVTASSSATSHETSSSPVALSPPLPLSPVPLSPPPVYPASSSPTLPATVGDPSASLGLPLVYPAPHPLPTLPPATAGATTLALPTVYPVPGRSLAISALVCATPRVAPLAVFIVATLVARLVAPLVPPVLARLVVPLLTPSPSCGRFFPWDLALESLLDLGLPDLTAPSPGVPPLSLRLPLESPGAPPFSLRRPLLSLAFLEVLVRPFLPHLLALSKTHSDVGLLSNQSPGDLSLSLSPSLSPSASLSCSLHLSACTIPP